MINHENSVPSEPLQLVEQQPIIQNVITSPEQQKATELNITIFQRHNSSKKIACEIPPPPPWLGRAAYWFRLGFAAVILISSLLSLTSCGVSAEEAQWYPASKYFERSLLNQIVTENSSLKPSEEVINKIQVSQLAKQPPLILVDFDNAELCGQLGCLYTIYLEKGGIIEKIYSRYLSSKLPKGVQLFEISDRTQNDLPCVVVNQIAGSNLNKLSLCYDGLLYQNDDLSVVKIKSESNP